MTRYKRATKVERKPKMRSSEFEHLREIMGKVVEATDEYHALLDSFPSKKKARSRKVRKSMPLAA